MSIKGFLLLLSLIALLPPAVHAQAPRAQPAAAQEVSAARAHYLERWLGWMSRERQRSRTNGGVRKLIAAAAFGTSSVAAIAFEDAPHGSASAVPDRTWRPSIALTTGVTAALLADGIVALSSESSEEERYQRWLTLRVKDETTVALFEGELAAAAAEARLAKSFTGAIWIGVASTGATMLALTPFERFGASNEAASYGLGAVLLGIGAWKAIASFTGETWNEQAYRLYQERRRPRPVASLNIAPSFAANGGGLTLSGTF